MLLEDLNPLPPATHASGGVRRYPRALFSVPITLHHLRAGGIQRSPGISLDISEGGLGALVQGGTGLGETVKLDLQMPGGALSLVAIVRHTSSVRSGFEFLGLTAEERLQITSAMGSTQDLSANHSLTQA